MTLEDLEQLKSTMKQAQKAFRDLNKLPGTLDKMIDQLPEQYRKVTRDMANRARTAASKGDMKTVNTIISSIEKNVTDAGNRTA